MTGKWKSLLQITIPVFGRKVWHMSEQFLEQIPKRYITDEIGEEYKAWENGDIIFIKAPTGSGKSYFILHIFLKWVVQNGFRLLYLVNRRVLQEQLQEEIDKAVYAEMFSYFHKPVDLKEYIQIRTYQNLESCIKRNIINTVQTLSKYNYVVCDECHYFYTDSNFNTNTELSFDCIRREFDSKIQIYMSATMDKLKGIYTQREPRYFEFRGEVPGIPAQTRKCGLKRDWEKAYSVIENYDYIDLYEFQDLNELQRIIISGIKKKSEKWLIFVDSIDYGKRIEESLLNLDGKEILSQDNLVFIDANYDKDEEAKKSVRQIVKEKCADKQIIISTAVMDNGISLYDFSLRNIAILVDTEESSIQMLGRKRKDERRVNLYICQRDIAYFQRRLRYVENIITVFQKNLNGLKQMYQRPKNMNREQMTIYPYVDYYYRKKGEVWSSNENGFPISIPYCVNYDLILEEQQTVLEKIISSDFICSNARKLCYSIGGLLAVNNFSVLRSFELQKFYQEMIIQLENDSEAFIKEQVSWLGLPEDCVGKVLEAAENEKADRYRARLAEGIEALNGEVDKGGNKAFKKEYKIELLYFLQKGKDISQTQIDAIKKIDRPLTASQFNACMQAADLSYEMEGSNPYIIKRL